MSNPWFNNEQLGGHSNKPMIDHKKERELYLGTLVIRYPKDILLIVKGNETVGQITVKDNFESNLWLEAIKKINEILKSLNESGT